MPEINYKSIVESLWKHYGDKMNEWEQEFIDNMVRQTWDYTENQKDVIIKLNRKYRVKR